MGGKVAPRPVLIAKCRPAKETKPETKPEKKPEAAKDAGIWKLGNKVWSDDWLAPSAAPTQKPPTPQKPAGTTKKSECDWIQGNMTAKDDWQKTP